MRSLPLSRRKTNLARLLARRSDGMFIAPFEQGEISPDLFRAACKMGIEGLVSKRRDRPYRAGRSPHWVKLKNPASPAMTRLRDETNPVVKALEQSCEAEAVRPAVRLPLGQPPIDHRYGVNKRT